ncbi:MAG: hypothetical protein AAGA03_08690 [Planctomycetota bacterium]
MSDLTPAPVVRSRLLPRFSFLHLFAVTTAAAVLLAVARQAQNGGAYAAAVLALVGTFLLFLVGMSVVFLVAWAISGLNESLHEEDRS